MLQISFNVLSDSRNDDYLWGVYIGSRASILKKYDYSKTKNNHIEYKFPVWWTNKIIAGFPEPEEMKGDKIKWTNT